MVICGKTAIQQSLRVCTYYIPSEPPKESAERTDRRAWRVRRNRGIVPQRGTPVIRMDDPNG
jgi:hypothetical protein